MQCTQTTTGRFGPDGMDFPVLCTGQANSGLCAKVCSKTQVLQIHKSLLQDDQTLVLDPK